MSEQKILSSSGLQRVWTKIKDLLGDKVDKIAGKGLSTNDYTTNEKNKLAGIAQNAEVNVQSDWEQTDTSSDSYIQHKPDLPGLLGDKVDKVDGKGLSTNDYTTTEKNKLAGIAQGAEVNVQSDWEQSDSTKDDFIKHKPDISGMLAGKVDNQYNPIYSGKVLGIDNTGAVVPVTGGGGGSGGSIGLYSVTLALNVAGYTETTIADSSVKANMRVVEWFTDTDTAQSDDWSITTADGSYTFVGTIKTAPAVLTVIFGTDGTNILQEVSQIEQIIGNTALPTTAQTLTGAVAELSSTKLAFEEVIITGETLESAIKTYLESKPNGGIASRIYWNSQYVANIFGSRFTENHIDAMVSVYDHSAYKYNYHNGTWTVQKLATDAQISALNDTITDFCDVHFFNSQMPTVRKGIMPFSINGGQSITIGGITIPGYSKGIIVSSSNNGDATAYAVDTNGNLYTVYKNGANWVNGSKLPKDAAYHIGIRGIENQLHGVFANTVEFIKYCRDLRTTDPTPLGRNYCPWTFQCDGIASDSFFGTSGFTVIAFFTSVNYGWIHCLSDNASQGFVHICVNSTTAYLQKPTTTRTTISLE